MAFSLLGPAFPFGPLLERQFSLLIAASRELEALLANPAAAAPAAGRVRDLEQAARLTFREVGRELGLTRLLPLERADLHALSLALEETTRALVAVAARASLYGFTAPRPAALSLAGSLGEMLTLTARMLERLRRGDTIAAEIAAVERLTEETDSLLLVALGELYEEEAEAAHPIPLLRWSHLLDRLETALDGAGRIATILESLVIKHA